VAHGRGNGGAASAARGERPLSDQQVQRRCIRVGRDRLRHVRSARDSGNWWSSILRLNAPRSCGGAVDRKQHCAGDVVATEDEVRSISHRHQTVPCWPSLRRSTSRSHRQETSPTDSAPILAAYPARINRRNATAGAAWFSRQRGPPRFLVMRADSPLAWRMRSSADDRGSVV
jgi:hypothetical protein